MADRKSSDEEKNRFSARAARYARVGANVGGVAARYPAGGYGRRARPRRRCGRARRRARQSQGPADEGRPVDGDRSRSAAAGICRRTAEAAERSAADGLGFRQAPHDGGTRRPTGKRNSPTSSTIRPRPPRSARCIARVALDGAELACKLQYPDMQSAVEADLQQLEWLLAIRRRMDPAIDTREIAKEIGARVREELDYRREAKHAALYRTCSPASRACAFRAPGRNSRPAAC